MISLHAETGDQLILLINTRYPARSQQRKSPRHTNAVPDNVELATHDLFPPNRNLNHGNVSALRQHEHLDVEDPAFRVHVRDDVGERRSRKELEATLRILYPGRVRRRHDAQEDVERMHEEVAEG